MEALRGAVGAVRFERSSLDDSDCHGRLTVAGDRAVALNPTGATRL